MKLTELLAGQMEVGTKKKAVATHYYLIKIQTTEQLSSSDQKQEVVVMNFPS